MLANCATSDPFIQAEPVTITYSDWDGSGHRRTITVKKGDTVGQFLSAVRQQLQPEFREMRATSVENILYVKEGTRRHLLLPAVLRAPSVRAPVGLYFGSRPVVDEEVCFDATSRTRANRRLDPAAPLHVLRFHPEQGQRQVRSPFPLRCP